MKIVAGLVVLGFLGVQGMAAQESPSQIVTASVISTPANASTAQGEGMLLDGLAAEWHTTADGDDFHFIQSAVDKYLALNDGKIEDAAMGMPVLLAYRVTLHQKYYDAAKALHDQLAENKESSETAPFLAAYAATFHQPDQFGPIAKGLLASGSHAEDISYALALVNVLDWVPIHEPQRPELIAALKKAVASDVKSKHAVNTKGRSAADDALFVYVVAKGVRMSYLPQSYEADARSAWATVQKSSLTTSTDGKVALKDAVSDGRKTGAFLLAGSEMEQSTTEALGQGKTVLVDAWFNSQTRKNAAGQTELFHYKWDDDTNNGFSFFGRAFQRYGAKLATEKTAPTAADLKKAQIYILPSPDIPSKNPNPHYMDPQSVQVISDWVKAGGVLLLMENDGPNAEFEHFNTLSEQFGIHFNQVLRNHVVGNDHEPGNLVIPAGTGVFAHSHLAYMKDTCSISVKAPARAVVTKGNDVMIAVAKYGKGTVFAVVDPWVYNEYTDRRNHLPVKYDNFAGAIDLAGWAVKQ